MNIKARLTVILAIAAFTLTCGQKSEQPIEGVTSEPSNGNEIGGATATVPTETPPPGPSFIVALIDDEPTNLIAVTTRIPAIVEDLKYATSDNFMGRRLYADGKCYLIEETVNRLAYAQRKLSERRPGFRLKVWDCYRPMTVQNQMWMKFKNTPYVANPRTARHPRGRAVDITIVDDEGRELEMPTGFDDFTSNAHPDAPTTAAAAANRRLLKDIMTAAGFTGVNSEWWHFDCLAKSTNVRGISVSPIARSALSNRLNQEQGTCGFTLDAKMRHFLYALGRFAAKTKIRYETGRDNRRTKFLI